MNLSARKLLFMSDAPHFGGAERYVCDLAIAAKRRGVEPVVCWVPGEHAARDVFAELQRQAVTVRVLREARGMLAFWRGLQQIVRQESPDGAIVNASGRPCFWMSPWIARHAGVPSAWVHHMIDQHDYRRAVPSRLGGRVEGLHLWRVPQTTRHRLAAIAATTLIALNERDRRQIARDQNLRPQRVAVVPNGVNIDRYAFSCKARQSIRAAWMPIDTRSPGAEPFVIGTAGRLVSSKGIEMLVDAAAALRRQAVPVLVVVAGEGPQQAELESFAQHLGVRDAVRFLGFAEDMPAFYSGLDVFVSCSRTESFGLAITEAMACERSVVATPTAGAAAQIQHDGHGCLLESFSTHELVRVLSGLHAHPGRLAQLGRNARAHVACNFSIDQTLETTLQLLNPRGAALRADAAVSGGSVRVSTASEVSA